MKSYDENDAPWQDPFSYLSKFFSLLHGAMQWNLEEELHPAGL